MTYSFVLAHPESDKSSIIIVLRDRTKRKTISTGISISTKNWVNGIIRKSEDSVYAGRLAKMDMEIGRLAKEIDADDLGLSEFYNEVVKLLNNGEDNQSRLFLPFYQYWATNSFNRHHAHRGTLLHYRVIAEYVGRRRLTFDDIDYSFFIKFLQWLEERKGYSKNTQGIAIQYLKAVMNEAFKRNLHSNKDYINFYKPKEDVDNVYLSLEECENLYNLELSGTECIARDLFLIGCYTGMRVSDYSRLTPYDINDGLIYFEQKKTKGKIIIPAHKRVVEIVNKYGGSPQLSEQKLNKHIKAICRKAGIDEMIGITINGKREYKPKYMLVSSHTARRSAATNMALNGTPLRDIMQITGHKSEATLLKYIKITKEENARRLKDNPFFKD